MISTKRYAFHDILLGESPLKQVECVVALEPDREVRVDDMALDRRED
jgi:hypothetical protein